jgi:type IV pilus assembly protein PilN
MANINLLPWRDELRLEQRKEFFTVLFCFALSAIVVVGVFKFVFDVRIENQQARNAYLESQISDLNTKIKEIEDLKKQKSDLVDRMSVIQSLQGDRPEIVHIFDEIVRALPDGVYFNSVTRKGSVLNFKGAAESNNRVSSLMRQLEASSWMSGPSLRNVIKNTDFGPQGNSFELTVSIVSADNAAENKK